MKTLADRAQEALYAVANAPEIVYDVETSGLDWKTNSIVGYVITVDADNNWYIPIRHGGGGNLLGPNVAPLRTPTDPIILHPFEKALAKAFEERRAKGLTTIGHNIKFDSHMSWSHGILLGRSLRCTQVTESLIDEYAGKYSLDSCAGRHGVTAKKGQTLYDHMGRILGLPAEKKIMEHFWKLAGDDPVAVDYALGDGVTTLELYRSQMKAIAEENLSVVWEMENRLIWTVVRMERKGIKIDEAQMQAVIDNINGMLGAARASLPRDFNERSPKSVRAVCEAAGRLDWPTTEKGNPSFTEAFLKTFDTGANIVRIRKLSNLLNSFITPLKDEHMFEGRVHANLNQSKLDEHGTISGRFSCSNPNLQQVPKRDKELGPLFRSIFVPDSGYEFYEADYSQCEPRLFAHYSNEASLIEGYNRSPPRDMHAVVADMMDVQRDPTAKRMNMGILTGMQAKTFAMHMGWDETYAREKFDEWFQVFPGIKEFQNTAKKVLQTRGYVKTLLGRRGRLDDPRYAYKAVSKIIQGGNADIIKYKLLQIDEWLEAEGDKANLLMTVHDSFVWQAPATPEGRAISARIEKIMTDVQTEPFKLRVPFIVEVGKGKNWSEATYG